MELIDIEMEMQDQRRNCSFFVEAKQPPVGLEFEYMAYNVNGDLVCSGVIAHLPDVQINVTGITTPKIHQHKGYASSTVLELSRLFNGLPIVPVREQYDGVYFWPAVRERFSEANLVRMQTDIATSQQQVQEVADSKVSRDYTPQCVRHALKRVPPKS